MSEKMKDSGVDWIGEIPEGWETIRFKYLLDIKSGVNLLNSDMVEGDYEVLGGGNSILGTHNKWNVDEKNILIARVGSAGTVNNVIKKGFATDNALIVSTHQNKQFIYYLLLASDLSRLNTSNAQPLITATKVLNFKVVVPSTLREQKEIADYLDKQTSKFDQATMLLKDEIERLRAYKKSLIYETVTKGLDKNVQFKDSGVDWIGEIPVGWEVSKIRYLGELQNGISKDGASFGMGYPFVSYGDVYNNLMLPENIKGKVQSNNLERRIFSVKKGDVFFTRTSETVEEIGFISVAEKDIEDATFAGFLIRFRLRDETLNTDYLKYYLSSQITRKFFVKEMMIVTRASLGQNLLKNLSVIIPTQNEQQKIANYLDKKTKKIDKIIKIKEEQVINLLKQQKNLIYEMVTGKKNIELGISNGSNG